MDFCKGQIAAIAKEIPTAAKTMITYGGGYIIDGTKFISAAMDYKGDIAWDLMLNPELMNTPNPVTLATILTLPATAPEMNCGGNIPPPKILQMIYLGNYCLISGLSQKMRIARIDLG